MVFVIIVQETLGSPLTEASRNCKFVFICSFSTIAKVKIFQSRIERHVFICDQSNRRETCLSKMQWIGERGNIWLDQSLAGGHEKKSRWAESCFYLVFALIGTLNPNGPIEKEEIPLKSSTLAFSLYPTFYYHLCLTCRLLIVFKSSQFASKSYLFLLLDLCLQWPKAMEVLCFFFLWDEQGGISAMSWYLLLNSLSEQTLKY